VAEIERIRREMERAEQSARPHTLTNPLIYSSSERVCSAYNDDIPAEDTPAAATAIMGAV